jgi:hypothetical protein
MTANLPRQAASADDADDDCNNAQSTRNMHAKRKDDMKSAQRAVPSGVADNELWND